MRDECWLIAEGQLSDFYFCYLKWIEHLAHEAKNFRNFSINLNLLFLTSFKAQLHVVFDLNRFNFASSHSIQIPFYIWPWSIYKLISSNFLICFLLISSSVARLSSVCLFFWFLFHSTGFLLSASLFNSLISLISLIWFDNIRFCNF